MDHSIGRLPANQFPKLFPRDFSKHKRLCVTASLAAAALLLLLSPIVATVALILLLKPDGALSYESNTVFWLVSSLALAVVILTEAIILRAIGRFLDRIVIREMVIELEGAERSFFAQLDADIDQDMGEGSLANLGECVHGGVSG
jgi:hypothetical protein